MSINMANEAKATNKQKDNIGRPKTKRTLYTPNAHRTSHYRYLCHDSSSNHQSNVSFCDITQLPSHIRLNERYYLIINKIEYACRMLEEML